MAANCETDRHVARHCWSIVETVSKLCYPHSARAVGAGKRETAQQTTGHRGSSVVERTRHALRDPHAVVGRRICPQEEAGTRGRSAGVEVNRRRQDDGHEEKRPGRGRQTEGTGETQPVSGPRPLASREQDYIYRAVRVTVVDHDEIIVVSPSGTVLPKESKRSKDRRGKFDDFVQQ